MAYVERMIAPGEEMIGVSRIHWIHVVQGLLWLIGLMALGFVLDSLIAGFFGLILPSVQFAGALLEATWLELFFLCAGLYIFSVYFIHFATTEVALTNQRVIYKRGWIFVDIKEVNLDEIKGSNIDLGLLGRFLGYGSIALDARFVRDTQLPFINEPYRFVRAMNEAQVNIEDHFALVLDDGHQKKARFEHRKRHVPPEENSRSGPQKVVESVDEAVEASATSPAHAEDSPVELKITSKGASLERAPQAAPEQENALVKSSEKKTDKKQPQKKEQTDSAAAEAPAPEDHPAERPQAEPHAVAEGSYEEEKLKEELIEEWEDHSDNDTDNDYDDTAHRSRAIH